MLRDEVFFAPLSELAPDLRAGRLSPVELANGFLDRIGRFASRFNAFETVTAERALEQARAAEAELHRGHWRGPLHGVPYAAKDLLDTQGIPTAWGTKFLRDRVPDEDATVVTRLRDAGAVLLGKAAMVEFAGCLGYRFANASATGPGRNPWNPQRWTGGSSSGSAAAVAGGLATFAIGTETWGSILCPSAFCGLTGLRPTYGRVSRAGGMVGAYTFDKIGPLARGADDCREILRAIAGPDPRDVTSASEPVALEKRAGRPVAGLRAALVLPDWKKFGEPEVRAAFEAAVAELRAAGLRAALVLPDWKKFGEPEVRAAFEAAVAELRAAGLAMEEAALPGFPASEVSGMLIGLEALAAFEPFLNDGRAKLLVDDLAWRQREIAAPITGADAMKAWRMRYELQRKVADFLAHYDVVVTPNFLSVAPPVDQDLNQSLPYPDPVGAIGVACGLPAIALPCGFGRDHLPASLQILGAPFDEATLLDLGDLYQSRTHWNREHATVA